MSRWIDAEWLKSRVHYVTMANGAIHGCVDKLDLIEAPSINIVRCKECKHAFVNENHENKPLICGLTKRCGTTDPNWYCADGERREP